VRAMLAFTDRVAGGVARGATTLGQCALVALGVHLAADSLAGRLLGLELPLPVSASAWAALGVELLAIALFWDSFVLSPQQPRLVWRRFRAVLGIRALVLPFSLSGVLLAGSWSLSMALEDLLPASPWARPAAALVGLAVCGRFGWPALLRALACLEPPKRWSEGLPAALILTPIGLLAWFGALPLSWLLP